MKLHYYPETDSLYVDLDRASRRFDLSTLETEALPLRSTKAG